MRMKEKLQSEMNDFKEKYLKVKHDNEILLKKEEELNNELVKLKAKGDISDTDKDEEYLGICKNLQETNQNLNHEVEELKNELLVIKGSNETYQQIVEETQKAGGDGSKEIIRKMESENNILHMELKKSKEQIEYFEKKSLEDEDNCQKLAFILESYEKQVSSLKNEVEDFRAKLNSKNDIETLYNNMKSEKEDLKKTYETELKALNEEIEHLRNSNEKEVSLLKAEIQELSNKHICDNEIETLYNSLKTEKENLQKTYEIELNALNSVMEQLTKTHEQQISLQQVQIEELSKKIACNTEIETLYNELKTAKEKLQNAHEIEIKALHTNSSKEIEQLTKEIEEVKKLNAELLVKASGRMDIDLEDELENIQEAHEAQLNFLREELEQLKNQDVKNITEENKIEELEEQKLEITRELADLQQQFDYVQDNHKVSLQELHNKYINIITENIKKFQECEKPSDFKHCINDDDPHVAELSRHVENIMKILLDLKCKCGDLEKQVLDLSEEKSNILMKKNHEIEKLIQNSDVLSQEIVTKNQTIKDYENECNEIAKNNELLINELETYKNNPMLQTISESNEDNMILLESQLENANKRIEDLEKIIDDFERQQPPLDNLNEESDFENVMKQLTENEISNNKKDYDNLLNNFDQLQIHYDSLKKELEETKDDLTYSIKENADLQFSLEKLRADYETLEYQVSEININSEGLKEETEEIRNNFKAVFAENSKLKSQNEETVRRTLDLDAEINNLHEKLRAAEESKKSFESQIEALTEKLKNFKMSETTLKLQYEQKNKELAAQSEARYNLEISLNKINADLAEFQNNFIELQTQNDQLQLEQKELREIISLKDEKVKGLENFIKELESNLASQSKAITDPTEDHMIGSKSNPDDHSNINEKIVKDDYTNLKLILDETVLEKATLQAELSKLPQIQTQLKESIERESLTNQQLQEVTNSRNELINMVTMKHQENVTYHNEIQRLNQILTAEVEKYRNLEREFSELKSITSKEDIETKIKEIEKLTDQNNFLKEKCEVIAKNLLDEQSRCQQLLSDRSEKEITLQKKVDRLQAHLIELEEHYTEELYQAEQKNSTLKSRVAEVEEREKSSSTMYTSVSIRANQQVESLQGQLQTVIQERDLLRKHISDAEDQNTKQAAALANLQFVLEQFRKDKEKDVIKETERIRRHIQAEKQVQEELRAEIANLKSQLEERNQGLLAASRLSDQLESSKKTISGLKDEVSQLQTKLLKTEEDLNNALSTTDGKVDKVLIKNLILGFVTSNNNMNRDQTQILKIIATVLDFNQQDHDKVQLNRPQQGWLASFLAPQSDNQNKMTEESLSRAFIKFLENESKPRLVPSLLNNVPSDFSTKSTSSRSTTPGQAPIVLSEIVLPTFSDFAQNRNSSSILKDVLKDNSS